MTCTEFCRREYDKAIDEGRMEDAENYRKLFEMWHERETKKD